MAKEQQAIDQRELLEKVTSNEINWRDALDIITSLKKPWHTKEWKEQRKVLLAPQCENCGSTIPPLVLQHTWHPTPIHKLFYTARKKYENEWHVWKQTHTFEVDTSSLRPDTDGCPKCGSTTIRYRKKAQTWICVSKPKGVTCGNVFDTPIRVISPAAIWGIEKAVSRKLQDAFDEEFGVGKKVVITALQHNIRYISLKDTKTLCKRCAFVEDKTKMILCSICKNKYHSKKYDRCSACAGIIKENL
ncbi:hypothetical protein MASR2M66_11110 [Chloroflexota bacterium]